MDSHREIFLQNEEMLNLNHNYKMFLGLNNSIDSINLSSEWVFNIMLRLKNIEIINYLDLQTHQNLYLPLLNQITNIINFCNLIANENIQKTLNLILMNNKRNLGNLGADTVHYANLANKLKDKSNQSQRNFWELEYYNNFKNEEAEDKHNKDGVNSRANFTYPKFGLKNWSEDKTLVNSEDHGKPNKIIQSNQYNESSCQDFISQCSNNLVASPKSKLASHILPANPETFESSAPAAKFLIKKHKRSCNIFNKITNCPHVDKKHYAKNMCDNCYHSKGRAKRAWNCKHSNKFHYALGLCQNCYQLKYCKNRKTCNEENKLEKIKPMH